MSSSQLWHENVIKMIKTWTSTLVGKVEELDYFDRDNQVLCLQTLQQILQRSVVLQICKFLEQCQTTFFYLVYKVNLLMLCNFFLVFYCCDSIFLFLCFCLILVSFRKYKTIYEHSSAT